jgi:SAM-dependent methyltransferase
VSAAYDELAAVYEFLVPDSLLEPEGAAAAFAGALGQLAPGARVLDCAAGTGQLAVGLALRGLDVTASDASAAMVERTRALAAARGVELRTSTCGWNALGRQGWGEPFDAVLCVGNSLTHAPGRDGRRAALAAMAGVLRDGGLLALTSRNWERLRAARPRLEVGDGLVERGGRSALVVRSWTIPEAWAEPHGLEVAVALLGDDGAVTTQRELLAFWPFTEAELREDLRASGLAQVASTYAADAERYLVTACRGPGAGAGAGRPRPAARP